jgi:xanthine dehydrogenase YagR molybdenum-binding subunit
VKVGAKKDGTLVAWESESWGSGGVAGTGMPPYPYVWQFANQKTRHHSISTHNGPQRAWRAPDHPQACVVTMGALEDLAAKLNIGSARLRPEEYRDDRRPGKRLPGRAAQERRR